MNMTNVQYTIKDDKLIITVDLTQNHGLSASGKTTTVGTSHGFYKLSEYGNGDISLSLNVCKKVPR